MSKLNKAKRAMLESSVYSLQVNTKYKAYFDDLNLHVLHNICKLVKIEIADLAKTSLI